ncbi:SpoIIE family protein phosphatase [Paenibacillus sp. LMG 31456]|uniref:SpoIIE family protein phosphatase n=1 Tax=Paenibacillus foliorum TaxID=2654974 RepID=A0A972GMV0_9BACL|nr:GAF domain-containing SpoIIE family protein phosphatase [Paenibacillus foliorum]NOU93619.1 SpoIIE family protein phosphatase [Paenibacillus foliorum]
MGDIPLGWLLTVVLLLLVVAAVEWKRREATKELRGTHQLFEVSLEINSTILKQDLLKKIMDTASSVTDAEASSVILVDPETGDLFFEVALGEKGDEIREIRLTMGEGIAGWVAQTGESVKIDDAARDPRWSSKVAKRVDYPTRSLMCVPITSKGAIIGVLQVLNKRNGKHFSDKDLRLLQSIASPTAVSLENAMLYDALEKSLRALSDTVAAKERMESELRIARDIQMGFLPRRVSTRRAAPIHMGGLEVLPAEGQDSEAWSRAGDYEASIRTEAQQGIPAKVRSVIRPAREVGGDFYDYFTLDESKLFFTLGDVSDKGIPAALFMAVTMTLIKGKMTPDMTPGQLLTEVNNELYKDESSMFATIFCGVLDMHTGKLTYSDGGHCTPYIIRSNGAVEPLRGIKGVPLGVMDDMLYVDNTVMLDAGERLVLYTDGITEAEDSQLRQYGNTRLYEVLDAKVVNEGEPRLSVQELMERILSDVDRFTDGALQSDDIAMLLIEHNRIE